MPPAASLAAPIYATGVDWLTLVQWRFLIGAALGWIWVAGLVRPRACLARMPRRALLVALALGALFTGNAGTYYAGLETVPAALAGVLVYTYPGDRGGPVAVVRDAAAGSASVDRARAGGRRARRWHWVGSTWQPHHRSRACCWSGPRR